MVRSIAYFNTKFVTGYVITQSDYVDLIDTVFNPENKKTYKALLSQSSFFPPQIVSNGDGTPFINNLSAGIVFSRASQGVYWGTLAGAFPDGKTFLSITSRGSGTFFSIQRIDDDTIEISTADSIEPLDSILNKTSILIEIYP